MNKAIVGDWDGPRCGLRRRRRTRRGKGRGRGRDGGPGPVTAGCSDLFQQGQVAYSIDIAPADWDAIVGEFNNLSALAAGEDFATYHPVTFHAGNETVAAAVKLHGQSSWLLAAMFDGAAPRCSSRSRSRRPTRTEVPRPQQADLRHAPFGLDVPARSARPGMVAGGGIMAPCSASAELSINGQYYGLFSLQENVGRRLIKQFFPNNASGDSGRGARSPTPTTTCSERGIARWRSGPPRIWRH